jgi:Pyruvate/2-oxoacid:ferredoxin oxidoreductase gamma subunit
MDIVRPKTIDRPVAGAAGILIVGPLGQGVGLAADALALAAARAGLTVATSEFMRPALGRRACAALVRIGQASNPGRGSAHWLLAFGAAAALEARPLLAETGSGLALVPSPGAIGHGRLGPMFDRRVRWWAGPAIADAPSAKVWAMLGWLSGRVALPMAAWREALEALVPGRLSGAAKSAFQQGRLVDCRPRWR